MLSLFRKKPDPQASLTLKSRVHEFWKWYSEVAPRFHQVITARQARTLVDEVSSKINSLFPGFAWVFGPSPEKDSHSFTLSGEGNRHLQLISIYCLSQAPQIPGWTFYASRQPGKIEGMKINLGSHIFDPIEFWISPQVDIKNERFDLTVWHPLFDTLPEKDRWTILFLFLDEALGEYGTQMYIGEINLHNGNLADSIPLRELLPLIEKTKLQQEWKKYPPGEAYSVYANNEPHEQFLRGDIITGSTSHMTLVTDYVEAAGKMKDPLAGTGADYVFVSLAACILPPGGQSEARGELEEALENALQPQQSGKVLGGAHGLRNAYIDLVLFDGAASLKIVEQVLREKQLPAGTEIHFFAQEKRGHRVIL